MPVESREEKIELKTYLLGPEDPNPPFQRKGYWSIYPYSLMDDLREGASLVSYRALVLENEYLRVIALPELGGRLYSAVDKATGEELFYRNHVVKPGLIGLRGAWISGGIEFNFPRGHSVTGTSPVDSRLAQEEGGAAAIWVGDVEQVHRMAWAVGLRLRPGSSLIETEVRLTNRTSLPHPYYFWANAAVPARDDMRLVYPATRARTWQGPVSWPIHEGRDLSRYPSYRFSSDSFMLNSLEDFFGVYYDERDFGVVHVADVNQCFGKKFFTWGTAEGGMIWASALSDEDGPYCEIQSGRYVDQGTWRLLPPHHTERWMEYWYPVKGIGGFAWANREAAVRLAEQEGRVECGVVATRPLVGALLRISSAQHLLHEQRADLSPDHSLRLNLPRGPTWPAGPLTLTLLEAGGRELIRYTGNQPPRTIALREAPSREEASEEAERPGKTTGALLREAVEVEQAGDLERARSLYEEAIAADPQCLEALVGSGRLAITLEPEEAVGRLSQAAALAPESVEAAYYLGVALRRAGRAVEAETELWRAAQRPEFAHSARVELGLIAMGRGDWPAASAVLGEALGSGSGDTRASCLLAAALRHEGRAGDAMKQVAAAAKAAPLDRLAAAEAHFCCLALGRPRLAATRLRDLGAMIPGHGDPWLELALDYADAGLAEEPIALVTWAMGHVKAVSDSPLAHYALAYWLGKQGQAEEAADHRRRARSLSPHLVFPHHWELEAMLRDALAHDPADGPAHYYFGMLLYSEGRREEGLAQWERAAGEMAHFAVFHRNLGLAHREASGNLPRAAAALRKAVESAPPYPRPYLELDAVLQALSADPRDRLAVLDATPPEVQRRGLVAAHQIAACLECSEWDRAISLLSSHTFHRWEAEFRMRALYVEAHLGRGGECFDRGEPEAAREDFEAALDYPTNLRIGKPAQTEDARPRWCAGLACEALGEVAAARAHWEAAAAEHYHRHTHTGAVDLHIYRALSLAKLGRAQEANELLAAELKAAQQRVESAPNEAVAHLALGLALKAAGRRKEADAALRKSLELNPWQPRAKRLLERETIL